MWLHSRQRQNGVGGRGFDELKAYRMFFDKILGHCGKSGSGHKGPHRILFFPLMQGSMKCFKHTKMGFSLKRHSHKMNNGMKCGDWLCAFTMLFCIHTLTCFSFSNQILKKKHRMAFPWIETWELSAQLYVLRGVLSGGNISFNPVAWWWQHCSSRITCYHFYQLTGSSSMDMWAPTWHSFLHFIMTFEKNIFKIIKSLLQWLR